MSKTQTDPLGPYKRLVETPLQPMTLRVGVAGRRALPADMHTSLTSRLHSILRDISEASKACLERPFARAVYDASVEPRLRIVTSLAEGADRLCVQPEVLPPNTETVAILPFAAEVYRDDFSPEQSVVDRRQGTTAEFDEILAGLGYPDAAGAVLELDGNPLHRDAAYNRCSRTMLAHSDLLIAITDGQLHGACGTAYTVQTALASGMPVVLIRPDNDDIELVTSADFGRSRSRQSYTAKALVSECSRILLFEDVLACHGADQCADRERLLSDRFARFRDDIALLSAADCAPDLAACQPISLKPQKTLIPKVFGWFKRVLLHRANGDARAAIPVRAGQPPDSREINPGMPAHHFFSAYLAADRLANHYGAYHRGTFLLIYLLGATALLVAALALALISHHFVVLGLVAAELVILLTILRLHRLDHQRDYHGRWLEYRCLAEMLRPSPYFAMLGHNLAMSRVRDPGEWAQRELIGHGVGRSWVCIYLESAFRRAPVESIKLSEEYCRNLGAFINRTWVSGQIEYHARNAHAMHTIGHRLGGLSKAFFFATLVVVLLKLLLVGYEIYTHHEGTTALAIALALATAGFPVLASFLFAIRNHAEFDISAQRSRSMLATLEVKQATLSAIPDSELLTMVPSEQLAETLAKIAAATLEDAQEWLEVYEVKESELG